MLRVAFAAILALPASSLPGQDTAPEAPAGAEHTCGLGFGGSVKCWGTNFAGQLGDGTNVDRNAPVDVVGLGRGVTAIATGSEHTCAVIAGGVRCWGANFSGQLGDGTNANRNSPVDVSGLSWGVTAIAAGAEHTCAVVAGGVKCWGANFSGQLGDGTNANHNTPTDVSGPGLPVTALAAGGSHTCALSAGGAVKCWGTNFTGQLGDGSNVGRNAPVDVLGLPRRVTAIAVGGSHTCALSAAGAVSCWGTNSSGQLGDGTRAHRNVPVAVSRLGRGMTAIAAGGEHTCALTDLGAMQCWGANASGQLGDGTNVSRDAPVDVAGLPTLRTWVRWRWL